MRLCKPCGEIKPLDQFNKDKKEKDGIRYYCKSCAKVKKSDYLQRKNMNLAKYEREHRGLSAIAKKVFEATPILESWNATAISAEMRRLGSGGGDSRVTLGCLNTLISAGLVVEVEKGTFRRVEVREPVKFNQVETTTKEVKVLKAIETKKPEPIATTAESTPIDRLSAFAVRLRALADDMENTALDLAEKAEKNEAETAKMRQLQAILKSLG